MYFRRHNIIPFRVTGVGEPRVFIWHAEFAPQGRVFGPHIRRHRADRKSQGLQGADQEKE